MTKKLSWTTDKRKVGDLTDHPANPRSLSKKSHQELLKSFKEFDYVELAAVDTDNVIIAGHQRVHIMLELGWEEKEIDVRIPNRKLTENERRRYLLRSNKNVGDWDFDILANEWEISELIDAGFTEKELLDEFGGAIEEIEAKEEKDEAQKKLKSCPNCGHEF